MFLSWGLWGPRFWDVATIRVDFSLQSLFDLVYRLRKVSSFVILATSILSTRVRRRVDFSFLLGSVSLLRIFEMSGRRRCALLHSALFPSPI